MDNKTNIINLDLFRTLFDNTNIDSFDNTNDNNTNDNNTNDTEDIKNILYMIKDTENGKEPIMFKICMGTATSEEINEWANEQGLSTDQIENTIKELKLSFTEGAKIAENIENSLPDYDPININKTGKTDQTMTNEVILNKLNTILEQIDNIKKDIIEISNNLKNRR